MGGGAVVGALAVLAMGSLSGCGPTSTTGSSAAAATSQPTTGPTQPTEPTERTQPARPSGTAEPTAADRTLRDDGIGGLSLGLSKKAAMATGLVGPKQGDSSDLCEVHTGKGDIQFVYLVAGKVSIIAVGPAVRLAKGIGVGDTYADLHAKYPQATDGGPGRLSLEAPGAKVAAHYRIGTDAGDQVYPDSKITEIALQADDQSCYE
jgi:hypothetical protein